MPGSHIPIKAPSAINPNETDYILILPWNIASVIEQNSALIEHDIKFITAVPKIDFSNSLHLFDVRNYRQVIVLLILARKILACILQFLALVALWK